jgi:DNA-binding transcriptional LysR family regulator
MVAVGATATMETGMDLQDLRSFQALAEELSFTAAARRLHVSQPSLSKRLQRLERRLGVTLFERTTSTVSLTPAGAWLLSRATALLAEWQAVTDQAHTLSGGVVAGRPQNRPALRLALPSLGTGQLPPFLAAAMPGHRVGVTAMHPSEASDRLAAGDGVDAVLMLDPSEATPHPVAPGAHVVTVVVEPVWVLLSARHRLAEQDEVSVEEVAAHGLPWVVSPPGDHVRPWEVDFLVRRAPAARLLEPSDGSQIEIARGRAAALVSPLHSPNELLALRPLTPTTTVHLYLTWRPDRIPETTARELLTALRAYHRETAQHHPRYWRWIRDHPAHYPGIWPDPPRVPAATLAEPAGA